MARAVLVQHHPRQRPPFALPAACPLARRLRNDASPLQMQLRPSVAPAEAVVLHQMLVEMLDREALVTLAIEPLHLLGAIGRDPLARRLAEPPVDKAGLAFLLVTARPAPERPLAHPEQLGRLLLTELRRFPAVEIKIVCALKGTSSAHEPLFPKGGTDRRSGDERHIATDNRTLDPVDSELSCPVLVAHQMSASSASVLLWDCGQRGSVVHISTGAPPSGVKRRVERHRSP